uniref:NADH-ubiquinone oxidoreductase chain 4 n=1 Tax=Bemisia tabaci TaxID=7038 RepID=A0A345U680_BEMTA|nr:NADH dehydrogenase subunit 4 [Bemisia tabaci]AXI95940.1 NADH dehydrogenase subunit 4 [Bemisia tabaci]AXI95953.1 NADH dehydrogenase subunit 4 [Bemisia tabaci]AXI95966.1 NADH dehydrogenase subunit 4 [Bemisia tabaci]
MKFLMPIMMMVITKTKKSLMFSYSLIVLMFNLNLQKQDMSKISYFMWGDELSFWTFDLSIWIIFILTFNKINQNTIYHSSMFMLLILLMLTFYSWNLMMFYFMFEISMIVVLSIIMTWGYQPERVEAALFMIMMTILTSLPFIISMMNNTTSLSLWNIHCMEVNSWEYMSLMLVFMMKMPTMFLHMWLPKVHVESPVQGSMILASILLKLGSYGLIRTTSINSGFNKNLEWIIMSYSMWTALTMSMICFIQTDLKTMIAYSSVVHMTLVFASITLNKVKSMMGSMYIMIGHGMCSAGLFYMANIIYKNSKSRSIIVNKSMFSMTPTAMMMWFFMCMGNSPMPPSINIMGEFFSFKSIVNWSSNNMTVILIMVIMFLSSLYSIFMFYIVTHSISKSSAAIISNFNSKNINTSVMLIIPMTLTSIDPDLLII